MPPAVKEATEVYRQDSDPLADFIEECCRAAPDAQVLAKELWKEHQLWERDNAVQAPLSRAVFSHRLEMRGFRKVRRGHQRAWTWSGISLRNVVESGPRPLVGPVERSLRTDADVDLPIVVS
jgi:phage/plasmid-associated DNA primase